MFDSGSIISWVIEVLLTISGFFLAHFVKKVDDRIYKTEGDLADLRNLHEDSVQNQLKRCADIHERENRKYTQFATKEDMNELKSDMRAIRLDIQTINNNVLALAKK